LKIILFGLLSLFLLQACAPTYRCGYDRNKGYYPVCGVSGKGEKMAKGTQFSGKISFYGDGFDGKPTASGETFDASDLTCAHRTLVFGTRLKVTLNSTQKSVVVRVNDRGPFKEERVVDLSEEAASQIGLISKGVDFATIEVLE
jgi:rare lipoprotein A